jgi:hypothetical protein
MTLRYRPMLEAVAPAGWIVWALIGTVWILVFLPVVVVLGRPLSRRSAGG